MILKGTYEQKSHKNKYYQLLAFYRNEIGISTKTEAYIQSLVLKKTLESISFDRRRDIEEDDGHNEVDALVNRIAVILKVVKSEDIQQQ